MGIQHSIQPFYQVSCQSDGTLGNEPIVASLGLKQSVWDTISKHQEFCKPLGDIVLRGTIGREDRLIFGI